MYARLDSKDRPRDLYLLRNMANPPPASSRDGFKPVVGERAVMKGQNSLDTNKNNVKGGKNNNKNGDRPGMGPHGRIFLGKDKATFGEDGVGYEPYDPEYECGGPVGTPGRQCPHTLREEDAMGLDAGGGRRGRILHVGIASYRDPLCPRTLYNMFTKAVEPESIRVRVLQQNDPDLDPDCLEGYCEMMVKARAEAQGRPFVAGSDITHPSTCPYSEQVYIHQVHAKEAKGPTWARGLLSSDFADAHSHRELSPQDFCMSIDSHMDFEPEWDANMIDMWDMVPNEYAVLSTYVAGTEQLGTNMNGVHEVPHLCMVIFTSNVRTHATKMCQELSRPKLTNAIWGAGLSFSKCHAELKVPVDPHTPHIFDGEEFNRAARFFTHGYDIYTPHRVYVLHDYHGSQHNPVTASWHRNTDPGAMAASQKRLKTMLDMPGGEKDDVDEAMRLRRSKFGLGDRRSLDQLIEFSGVDTRHEKFPVDGKNRCGNLKWVPFVEHPRGVNYIPRYDVETEDPLDAWQDDVTSVWYDPTNKAGGVEVGADAKKTRKKMSDNAVIRADPNAAIVVGRDREARDAHENLHLRHEELRRAIRDAERREEEAAAPVLSNAEAHAEALAAEAAAEEALVADSNDVPGALRGVGDGEVAGRKLVADKSGGSLSSLTLSHQQQRHSRSLHGWSHLPLPVQLSVGGLILGVVLAIYVSAGTGRGSLATQYKRRRRKAV